MVPFDQPEAALVSTLLMLSMRGHVDYLFP